jgi:predicted aspartyl protease
MLTRNAMRRLSGPILSGPSTALLAVALCLSGCQTPQPQTGLKAIMATLAATESPPDPTDTLPCQLDLVADLPLHEVAAHYTVDVTVNGMPARMLLDTGSFQTMLSSAAADRLALHRSRTEPGRTIRGVGGERRAAVYASDTLQVGLLQGRNWRFLVADLGLDRLNKQVDGLLASDFLSRYDVDIDLPGHKVALYYPEHDCSRPSAYLQGPLYQVAIGKTAVPLNEKAAALVKAKFGNLHPTYGTPYLNVSVSKQTLLAAIDTGAPHNVLFPSGMAKLKLGVSQFAKDARINSGGMGPDKVPAILHVIDEVDIGDLGVRNVPFLVLRDGPGRGGSPDLLLGLDVMKQIHFWISHTSGTLIMQYPPQPSPPPPPGMAPSGT